MVLMGPSQVGKSCWILKNYGMRVYYVTAPLPGHSVYFDMYEQEEIIWLPEFWGYIPQHILQMMLDSHMPRLPVKHGFVPSNVKVVIFDTNYHPRDWFQQLRAPMIARLTREGSEIWYKGSRAEEPRLVKFEDEYSVDGQPHPGSGMHLLFRDWEGARRRRGRGVDE